MGSRVTMSDMSCKHCLFSRREKTKLKYPCEIKNSACTPKDVLRLCQDNNFVNEKVIVSMICGIPIKAAEHLIASFKN